MDYTNTSCIFLINGLGEFKKCWLFPKPESDLGCVAPMSLLATGGLDRRAVLHTQTYGNIVNALMLLPHSLDAFIVGIWGSGKGGGPHLPTHTARIEHQPAASRFMYQSLLNASRSACESTVSLAGARGNARNR